MKYEKVTYNFITWLINNEYYTLNDFIEDESDMLEDFKTLEEKIPRLFNLLANITDQ